METFHPSIWPWGRVLALVSAAVVNMGFVARLAHAEGVVASDFFVAGGVVGSGGSLVGALGDNRLQASAAAVASHQAKRVSPRHTSPLERASADIGGDVFPRSRLVLPLLVQAAIDNPADAEAGVATMIPMTGPMVGLRPHPRMWGSTLER
ncbi:MAG: hypothetical protein ACKOOF_13995 [Planctomycetaceae bacterium]